MILMEKDEKESRARKIISSGGGGSGGGTTLDSDHPLYLSLLALRDVILTLADDENEAFTQLNVGGGWLRKFWMEDETKMFAQAVQFAEHPYDDIEAELERRGIKEKIVLGQARINKEHEAQYVTSLSGSLDDETKLPINLEVINNEDGTITITKYIEKPLHFTNRPLARFAHEWMKRRVPADRRRVKELIDLAGALSERLGGLTVPSPARIGGAGVGEQQRRV